MVMKGVGDMENVNAVLAENILYYRKKCALSQDELAQRLGVTFQAVSKWENAKAAPDIAFLPMMADIFGCYIDELFSRKVKAGCAEFPWADDGVIRGVVCEGRRILQRAPLLERFTFEVIGDAKQVQSECNVEVTGDVAGGCTAGKSITVSGLVSGGCAAGGQVVIGGSLSGGCACSGKLAVQGSLSGNCNVGSSLACGGNLSGDVNCGGEITVNGNVEAKKIKGNVVCRCLKCDKVEGTVTIHPAD